MIRFFAVPALLGALLTAPAGAQAHCDAADGPVATAALKALDGGNVHLVAPYVQANAEAELAAAFEAAHAVRDKGPEAKALAERYFMETAVRLHRAGENASYTGLKPAGADYGPAIPAAEQALDSGELQPLAAILSHQIERGLAERFEHARHVQAAGREPATAAEVPAARERVRAELAFIGYAEAAFLAASGDHHAEGAGPHQGEHVD